MFYNTTRIEGDALRRAKSAAMKQDARVLRVFASNPGVAMTPVEVHQKMGASILLTSVRRSLHTLTKQGYLQKTEERVTERYGAPNHKWILSTKTINR